MERQREGEGGIERGRERENYDDSAEYSPHDNITLPASTMMI